jgi:hypothetical protein
MRPDIVASPPPAPKLSPAEPTARAAKVPQPEPEPERRTSAPPPVDNRPALFRWEAGPSGEIVWIEGAPRGPLVGRSIARAEEGEGVAAEVERAFAVRAPFRDSALTLSGEGPVAGQWKISGIPAFDPTDGRFAGYRGIALRETAAGQPPVSSGRGPALADPNSLRELVHELKTPLNAIMGFAEIIDGEYLGPADRNYRTRAAEIVAQARLLLSAIDDLDSRPSCRRTAAAAAREPTLGCCWNRSPPGCARARPAMRRTSRSVSTRRAAAAPWSRPSPSGW